MSPRKVSIWEAVGIRVAIFLILGFFLFPVYWMISTSFKTLIQAFAVPPLWLFKPTLQSYTRAFEIMPLHKYLINSTIVSVTTATICIACGLFGGYSLTRFNFKGRSFFRAWILGTQLIPPIAVLIPLFVMFYYLSLVGTRIGLILAVATFLTPFSTWLISGFIADLPREMEECAMVDGATRLQAIFKITFPLAAPGIAATWIITFIFSWNNFLFALALTREATKTIPVAVPGYQTYKGIEWGPFAVAGTLCTIPVLAFGLFVKRYLVTGLVRGAVKG